MVNEKWAYSGKAGYIFSKTDYKTQMEYSGWKQEQVAHVRKYPVLNTINLYLILTSDLHEAGKKAKANFRHYSENDHF